MKILLLLSLSITLSLPGVSQERQYRAQRAEFAVYNMGMGALAGGVGAWVNKKKEQRWHRVLFRGMAQGLLGGYLMQQGKNLTYQIYAQERYAYAWPAHLVHAAGASIVQNAASNRNFWEHWHINLWLLRLDYDLPDRRFQARVFPSGIYGVLDVRKAGKLNWSRSLKTGFIFLDAENATYLGSASVTSMAVGLDKSVYPTISEYEIGAHEVMHLLQYEGFVYINPLFNKVDAKWKEDFTWYKALSKYVYFDFNGLYFLAAYDWIGGGKYRPCYFDNFFEKEAEHYATRAYLNCP